jgi:hypothetical protein
MKRDTPRLIRSQLLLFILISLMLTVIARGQPAGDGTWKKYRNNVKFNVSSGLIYRNALLFAYERSLGAHQTFSIFGGIQQFPSLSGLVIPGAVLAREKKASGYNFGGDYRFYLAKENKYDAPHGLYIGPYASFYTFSNENQAHFSLDDGSTADGQLNTRINFISLGGQLGYQFVFWKRMTLDLILFGPSLTHYSGNLDLKSTLTPDQVSEETKKILKAIADRYPVVGDAIKNGSANFKGNLDIWGPGFRYSIHVGFRF